jgi:hypothetical protein
MQEMGSGGLHELPVRGAGDHFPLLSECVLSLCVSNDTSLFVSAIDEHQDELANGVGPLLMQLIHVRVPTTSTLSCLHVLMMTVTHSLAHNMQAFRDQGGSEALLHQRVSDIYRQPLPAPRPSSPSPSTA